MFIANKPSILIIDDDLSILRTFSRIFERRGYLVVVAAKGSEAIEKLRSRRFDVALVDLCLPDMEGADLFPLIQDSSPSAFKIMLTGRASEQASNRGADALLGKPIQPNELLSLIDSRLKDRDIEK
ncbi:response regulator [Candidatus Bathyarchaeota archaeon]|nr:response regulator [Candidatus Bathyarchaeota archaeon]